MNENITRRHVLTALAAAGGIGALGGAGTYAVFSDTARTRATFTSGSLDLRVHYDTTYAGAETRRNSGTIDGQESVPLPGYSDLKPGDSGRMTFCFEVTSNPAYLWVCGDPTADRENGRSDSEKAVDDTPNDGELAEKIDATLRYCKPDGTNGNVIKSGSFAKVFGMLEKGVALSSDGQPASPGNQTQYEPSASDGGVTGPCVCIEWKIPEERVGNEIQSDGIAFDLTFHAKQARHNDGTENPCGDDGGGNGGGDDDNGSGGGSDQKAISFIAFCVPDGTNPHSFHPTITNVGRKSDGDPISVSWETNKGIGHVAIKTGGGKHAFENFYYDGATSGTVTVGSGEPRLEGQESGKGNECPNHEEMKFNYNETSNSFERE